MHTRSRSPDALRATFLGWQGWLFESPHACVLIDPLLGDDVGRGPPALRVRFSLHPPRRFCWDQFPRVDAVFLSHEHEDHFNIPTLVRFARDIPIYFSERASFAGWSILREMGFAPRPWCAGQDVIIGDVTVRAFGPDKASLDEWDTLAYLVTLPRHGTFFTNVDIATTASMEDAVNACAGEIISFENMSIGRWRGTGRGRHGHGDRAGTFLDSDAWAEQLEGARPLAGQTFVMRDGVVQRIEDRTPFLETLPPSEWPPQEPFWQTGEELRPRCGRALFDDDETDELESLLDELARSIYGTSLFSTLYSIHGTAREGRRPTFVFLLLANEEREVLAYEYKPARCAFTAVDVDDDVTERYMGTLTCWANDLLAVLRGECEPRAIASQFAERWFGPLSGTRFQAQVLWSFGHPLRRPVECLARYRAAFADERETAARIARAVRDGSGAERS